MTRTIRRIHLARSGLIAILASLSSGCAQLSALDSRLQGLADRPGSTVASAEVAPREERNTPSLDRILADLQRGEYAQGRRNLARYLDRHPDDAVARAVLQQLEADPERVLGKTSHRYVVRPGDSYSALAGRSLGDPGLFLLLARYNDSSNPSALRVGEVIRLPGASSSERVASATRETRVTQTAPRPTSETVVALALPDRPLQPVPGRDAQVDPADPADSAESLQRQGLALLDQGEREPALRQLEAALEKDPALEPAASRVPELRQRLVADYHQRAVLRYRNQELDQAIALWDRVLAIDPSFEPARSYRARARELQRRLEKL
ncbi:MAG: hypothetical protein JXJ30_07340 [Halothiobacillaceae bacterium]|nr:hypothetical protein [Halothiobacillaceae bacterium]